MSSAGAPWNDPVQIGKIAEPPFVRLPDPKTLFAARANRFRALSEGHALAPYLYFLASLSDIQHRVQDGLAAPDMPPMALTMERLPVGTNTRRYRTTANTIFHVTEGTGETTIGEKRFSWQRGDTLAAPCWYPINHLTTSDAQLFVLSDEPLLRFSNYYRFEALD